MKKLNLGKNNEGLAGVIEALLLVALVSLILSTIQLFYIPEIMKQRESDHMDEVANQFSHLKSVIEIQSIMGVSETDQPVAYAPASSPITLGSDKLPYFVTSWSLGSVKINDKNSSLDNKLIIFPPPADIPTDFIDGIPLTSIEYVADNAYFDDQRYIFEGGGIILNQTTGEVMKVSPSITIENLTDIIKINYLIPIFVSKPGKNYSDLYLDTIFIRTNYTKHYTSTLGTNVTIKIESNHIDAWYQALFQNTKGLLWEYLENNHIEAIINPSPERIEITRGTKEIDVELTIVEIGVQIGPGIIG
jgi:hypothetical protein